MKFRRLWEFPMWLVREHLAEFRVSCELADSRALHQACQLGRGVEIRSASRLKVGRNVIVDTGVLLHCGGLT